MTRAIPRLLFPARPPTRQHRLSPPDSRKEIGALDGLRALAILLVIWCHLSAFGMLRGLAVGPPLVQNVSDFGFSGVFLFFTLSGFLLFLPYARALLAERPWPSASTFYRRRALRILPAYYAALVLLLVLDAGTAHLSEHLTAVPFLFALLQDLRWDAFDLSSTLDGPFWTLTIEWQFYLLLPWIALGLAKLAGSRTRQGFVLRLALGMGALIVLGLSARGLAAWVYYVLGQTHPLDTPGVLGLAIKVLYGTKGKYLEVFALGMGASLLYVWGIEQGGLSRQRGRVLGTLAVVAALAGLAGSVVWAAQAQRIPFVNGTFWGIFVPAAGWGWQVWGEWVIGLCFALLLLGVLVGPPGPRQGFSIAPLRFIGKISYSLYLWHFPLLLLIGTTAPTDGPAPYLRFVVSGILIVFLFCTGSYYLVERPFLRYRRAPRAVPDHLIAL